MPNRFEVLQIKRPAVEEVTFQRVNAPLTLKDKKEGKKGCFHPLHAMNRGKLSMSTNIQIRFSAVSMIMFYKWVKLLLYRIDKKFYWEEIKTVLSDLIQRKLKGELNISRF